MADPYNLAPPPVTSADRWFPIVPDDGADLAVKPRAVHCGGAAGAVTCLDAAGDAATFYIGLGVTHAIRPSRVLATGTTATGLVGLW